MDFLKFIFQVTEKRVGFLKECHKFLKLFFQAINKVTDHFKLFLQATNSVVDFLIVLNYIPVHKLSRVLF